MMKDTVRELTFEEEALLYEKEARAEFAKENGNDDSAGVNNILRRGMRIIRKARALIGDKKPMTNGDRIRAMTDEELAGFLKGFNWDGDVSNVVCDMCAKKERHCGKDMDGECPISDTAAALMWLRHAAEVEK